MNIAAPPYPVINSKLEFSIDKELFYYSNPKI